MTIKLAKGLDLPAELTTRRSAFFGISGSGKSNSATVCIEYLLAAGEQVVLIDPKGEGWGLQSSADGKTAGFDVIVFGKPRGDIPDLREEHGEQIADFVVDSGRSVVLSLLGFDSDQSERRFVTQFFKRLYRRKSQQDRKTRTLVVLEEAHLFVPQDVMGAQAEMVGAIQRIARQGRSAGIGLMIVDQRPQDVSKKIISQTELLVCHQLVHKLDRAALQDWIKAYDREDQAATFLDSLAELQPGEAWVWSPAWLHLFQRAKMHRRKTYDSGATPDGSSAAAPKAKANIDLEALKSHLAKVVEQAKADDPKELKKQIIALKAEVAKLLAAPSQKAIVHKPADLETLEQDLLPYIELSRKAFDDLVAMTTQRIKRALQFTAASELTPPRSIAELPSRTQAVSPSLEHIRANGVRLPGSASRPSADRPRAEGISKAEQRVLNALAFWESLGVSSPNRGQLGLVAKLNPTSGHFDNVVSAMSSKGLVIRNSGGTSLTAAGRAIAYAPGDFMDLGEYHRNIRGMLKGGATIRMFDALAAAGGAAFTREELGRAASVNPASGHFDNCIGPLSTLGLISRAGGQATPTELLFPPQFGG